MTPEQWATTGAAAVVILGGIVAWFRWIRPRYRTLVRKGTAAVDSLVGRDEIRDSITGELIRPSLPGIGVRMASTEDHVSKLTQAVTALAQTHRRLDDHDRLFSDHDSRLAKLETASVERIVSRADSAAAFRAIEAVATREPDQEEKK